MTDGGGPKPAWLAVLEALVAGTVRQRQGEAVRADAEGRPEQAERLRGHVDGLQEALRFAQAAADVTLLNGRP